MIELKDSSCPMCIQTYNYQGPAILRGRDLALIVGLKNGVHHPENEYIFEIWWCGADTISLRLLLGRKRRDKPGSFAEHIKEDELLPYAKEIYQQSNRRNIFSANHLRPLFRALFAAALLPTSLLSEWERDRLQDIAQGIHLSQERHFYSAAAQFVEQWPAKVIKTKFPNDIDRATAERERMFEAEEAVEAAETLLALSRSVRVFEAEAEAESEAESEAEAEIEARETEADVLGFSDSFTLAHTSLEEWHAWHRRLLVGLGYNSL